MERELPDLWLPAAGECGEAAGLVGGRGGSWSFSSSEPHDGNPPSAWARFFFYSLTNTLVSAPATTHKAPKAGQRNISPRRRRRTGRLSAAAPPGREQPCRPPLLPSSQRHHPFQPPRHSKACGARNRGLSRLCVRQTERLRQRWDILMISWHKAVLISLRNGNEV